VTSTARRWAVSLAAAVGAVCCLVGYYAAGVTYYRAYRIPQGTGIDLLLPEEFTFLGMFAAAGGMAAVLCWLALRGWTGLERAAYRLRDAGWTSALLLATLTLLLSGALRVLVVRHQAVTDDEHTYRFIAQTLRTGSLAAPSPGGDLEFFLEQFVVVDEVRRFGKYPIGHPLGLLLGQVLGFGSVYGSVCAAAGVLLVFETGRRMFGRGTALLAAALYALSPAVLFTGATLLSQTTSTLLTAAATAALARGTAPGSLAVAGVALGLATLARPMPCLLVVAMVATWLLGQRCGARALAAFLVPSGLVSALVLVTNWAQSGHPLSTGYQVFHGLEGGARGTLAMFLAGSAANVTLSFVGNAFRLNAWLFGSPFSLAAVLAAPFRGAGPLLLWGTVASELAYRVLSPKVGVGITGPQYMMEAVPAMCLLAASALAREPVRRGLGGVAGVAGAVLATVVVSTTFFVPPRLRDLAISAAAQEVSARLVAARPAPRVVVFHRTVVPVDSGLSWAYFPRCNAPSLDDDVLFLYLPRRPDAVGQALEMSARRFPDRPAFVLDVRASPPALVPLAAWQDPLAVHQP
jgi:hypothetical protein